MKKIFSLSLAFIVCFIFSSSAFAEKKYTPVSIFNGTNWKKIAEANSDSTRMIKVYLVRGVYEGAYALDPENAYQQYGPWVSFGDLVKALDIFYSQERNEKIPLTYALILIANNGKIQNPAQAQPPDAPKRALVSLET